MENKNKTSGWMIIVYLSPFYLLAAYPLYKWHKKINSDNLVISKKDYREFSSLEGQIEKTPLSNSHLPQLQDTRYSVSYKSGAKINKEIIQPRENQEHFSNSNNAENIRSREIRAMGSTKGYLTSAVKAAMKKPEALKNLFNNSLVVSGFMNRSAVKSTLNDPKYLINRINNTHIINDFLNNKVVKEALNNPSVVNTLSSSKLINSVISSPAINDLINNPKKLKAIISANPQLEKVLSNPTIINALLQNPATSEVFSNLRGL